MLTYIVVLTLAIAGPRPLAAPRIDGRQVEVWTNRGESSPQDAFVTVLQRQQQDTVRRSPSAPPRRPETGGTPPTREPAKAKPARGGERDTGKRSEPELRRRKP